jgi:hypothetical protein
MQEEELDYVQQFQKSFTEMTNCVGFCENCGFIIMDYHGWRDMENRLCFECAETEEEAMTSPSSSSEEEDSEIDDPSWIPPEWLQYELDNPSDDSESESDESDYDEPVSGEVDMVGSF